MIKCCEESLELEGKLESSTDNKITMSAVPATLSEPNYRMIPCAYTDFCNDNERCVDTSEGSECHCKEGFKRGTDGDCHDVNECSLANNNCTKVHKECENLRGSFVCKGCITGYEKMSNFVYYDDTEDFTCVDIDECAGSHRCQNGFKCENTDGSYKCNKDCGKGCKKINSEFVDVNECHFRNNCQWKCENSAGSFKCVCPSGYFLQHKSGKCMDINECLQDSCRQGSKCTNVNGGFRCEKISCPNGYVTIKDSTDCKLATCTGSVCHRKILNIFKSFTSTDQDKVVFMFAADKHTSDYDRKYFEVVQTTSGYALMMKTSLKKDNKITLKLKRGRKEEIINIFVYVSEFSF